MDFLHQGCTACIPSTLTIGTAQGAHEEQAYWWKRFSVSPWLIVYFWAAVALAHEACGTLQSWSCSALILSRLAKSYRVHAVSHQVVSSLQMVRGYRRLVHSEALYQSAVFFTVLYLWITSVHRLREVETLSVQLVSPSLSLSNCCWLGSLSSLLKAVLLGACDSEAVLLHS